MEVKVVLILLMALLLLSSVAKARGPAIICDSHTRLIKKGFSIEALYGEAWENKVQEVFPLTATYKKPDIKDHNFIRSTVVNGLHYQVESFDNPETPESSMKGDLLILIDRYEQERFAEIRIFSKGKKQVFFNTIKPWEKGLSALPKFVYFPSKLASIIARNDKLF